MTTRLKNPNSPPPAQGLYHPAQEHDACGIGFVANVRGHKSHEIISKGIQVLLNLTHRGACGCDPETGDGAGILLQIPHQFFVRECGKLGFELPLPGAYGVGMTFLPVEKHQRLQCEGILERIVREEGFPPPGRYGPRAIQSIETFAAAVDETRARGWGMSYEEGERGIAAIAAPIRPSGPNTPAVATCSVAGPLMRFGAEDIVRNATLVMQAANEIAAIWPLRSTQTHTDLAAASQWHGEIRVAS